MSKELLSRVAESTLIAGEGWHTFFEDVAGKGAAAGRGAAAEA